MILCGKCKTQVDDASVFCPNCGAAVGANRTPIDSNVEHGVLRRLERHVFFRIARGFSWVIALLAAVGLGFAVILIIPNATKLLGGDTKVGAEDIRAAIEAAKRGRSYDAGQEEGGKIDPKLRARVDEAMYEIIALMPASLQQDASIENMRQSLRYRVASLDTIKEKTGALHEVAQVLAQFPESERIGALDVYFEIKTQKVAQVLGEKLEAGAAVAKHGFVIMAAIITITLVSMILVLLSIERNTRQEA